MSALEQLVGNMTVAQLAEAAGLSLDDVVGIVLKHSATRLGSPPVRKVGGSSSTTPRPKAAVGSFAITEPTHDTKSQVGRNTLDKTILNVLKQTGERMRAVDIRDAVGGAPAHVRARLRSLAEDGRVSFQGKAAGRRYWVKK